MMFDKLIGNEEAKARLGRMAASGRIPNALLFAGPEGVGKKEFAFEFARLLMCRAGGCGTCSICSRIGKVEIPKPEKGEDFDRVFLSDHPDVGLVVPYKRNLRVGSIRALEREANFRPFESERRIFVIDDAEKMNVSASNALLKTLEEPPATTDIIVISARPDSLLQTIRSRCQMIRFVPVEARSIETFLRSSGTYSAEDAALASRAARGSVAKALSLDLEWFRQMRGLLIDVIRSAILTGNIATMLQISEQVNDPRNKDLFEESVDILQSLIRDTLAFQKGSSDLANPDLADHFREFADAVETSTIERWNNEIEDMRLNLFVNINRKVAIDGLFARMAA